MTAETYIEQYIDQFSRLKRGFWNYEDGCMLTSIEAMYEATGHPRYVEAVKRFMDPYICKDGSIRWYDPEEYSLDKIPSGRALLFLHGQTGEEKYSLAAGHLMEQLKHQPRTCSGSFWHKKIYPGQIWLDGLYMAQPFYLLYEKILGGGWDGNQDGRGDGILDGGWDGIQDGVREDGREGGSGWRTGIGSALGDSINQFKNVRKYLYDEAAHLYIHAFDEEKRQFWADPVTGRSASFWSRAEGWYLMALADCCGIIDRDSEAWKYLTGLWQEAMDGMLQYQDRESSLFFQLTTLKDEPGNYLETSASAMVAYSLMKGYTLGVFGRPYFDRGEDILLSLETGRMSFKNGCLHLDGICAGAGLGPEDRPDRDGSAEYYLSETVGSDEQKGAAAFIMAYSQWLKAGGRESMAQDRTVVKVNDVYELRHREVEEIQLGYGTGSECVKIPKDTIADILVPHRNTCILSEAELIEQALDGPVGTPRLEEMAVGRKDVVIVTSDITRPIPSWRVLPHVMDRLLRAGVSPDRITVVFAVGTHRRHTQEEMRRLAGDEIYRTCRCMDSSECSFVHMGQTRAGTPVDIAEKVAHADLRICLGNIEYHFFAGYSGGAKAIMPGVSTMDAIRMNHSKMIHPMSRAGSMEGNPVREDLEEAAGICGVDFLLNVVLDEHKNVVYAVAGDLKEAHRSGCSFLDGFYRKEIKELADIVIVTQGGAPKDLNLYQTQKALANAEQAVRSGGIIILAGACPEGLGGAVFEQWMLEADSLDEILERIQKDFQIGGHKAASFARALKRARIFLVSGIDKEVVKNIFMEPFDHVQDAYDAAVAELGRNARVIVMPYGGSTLPVLGHV